MPPDGLYIDYKEFSTITKDLLKNANVLRDKSPNSPTFRKGRLGDASSNQTGSQILPVMLPQLIQTP